MNIKNVSLQGLEIYLNTSKGPQTKWLPPKGVLKLSNNEVSDQLKNLIQRRMIKVF